MASAIFCIIATVIAAEFIFLSFLFAVRWIESYAQDANAGRSWLGSIAENGFAPFGVFMTEMVYSIAYLALLAAWFPARYFWGERIYFDSGKLASGVPAVILIHGLFGKPFHMWLFKRELEKRGVQNIVMFSYKCGDLPLADIRVQLRDTVMRVKAATGVEDVALIGHSFGGLVAFDYAMEHGKSGAVKAIVAMAAPFAGSKLAALGLSALARSLHTSNPYFSLVKTLKPKASFLCVHSDHDQFVVPNSSASHPLADSAMESPRHGHSGFCFDPSVIKAAADWVEPKVKGERKETA